MEHHIIYKEKQTFKAYENLRVFLQRKLKKDAIHLGDLYITGARDLIYSDSNSEDYQECGIYSLRGTCLVGVVSGNSFVIHSEKEYNRVKDLLHNLFMYYIKLARTNVYVSYKKEFMWVPLESTYENHRN